MISKESPSKIYRNILEKLPKRRRKLEDDALFLIAQKADGALRCTFLSLIDLPLLLKNITLAKAAEVLNILDYDQYLKIVDLAKKKITFREFYRFQ